MNSKKIGFVVLGIIVLVGVFYGGMVYGKSQISTSATGVAAFANRGMRGGAGGLGSGGFTTGQIIAKDATSITVQLMTGGVVPGATTQSGSKIVFVDSNTKVTKQATGTLSDLAIGTEVSVTGTPNTDGSVSATAVQIRPAVVARPGQ
jgi:hypothetical protein